MSMSSSIDKVLEDYLASEPHKRYDSFVPLDFDQENYGMTQTKMLRYFLFYWYNFWNTFVADGWKDANAGKVL